jgi:sugar-specific transcriptional regulator TrmB
MKPPREDLRKRLASLGLNDREARLYIALLTHSPATASQLAVATRIPQNKIYQSLEVLIDAGLCQPQKHGRQRIFSSIDPTIGLAPVLKDLEHRLADARAVTQDLTATFNARKRPMESLADIEILRDREAIRQRYMQLLASTERDVAGFARGPFAFSSRAELESQFAVGRELRHRCTTRWVYELIPQRDDLLLEFLRDFGDEGDIRVSSDLPLKMVIFDRRTIIFSDDKADEPERMSLAIVHHPAVIQAFSSLFEFFWRQSLSITDWFARYRSA